MKERITANDLNKKNKYTDYISGELWKVVKDFPSYLISNKGRVFSLKRNRLIKQHFCPYPKKKGRVNYYQVILMSPDGKKKHLKIHKLVAQAFLPNPQGKPIVHHISGDELDNRADNLMWVTSAEHTALHKKMREQQNKMEIV